MRVVILLNPKINFENPKTADTYSEKSLGFSYNASIHDHSALAEALRATADMLDAKTVEDSEIE